MSDRANTFLEAWVTANVRTVAAEDQQVTAESLADLCTADALKAGITEDELRDAVFEISEGDLIAYMTGAIDAAEIADVAALTTHED